MLSGPGMAGLQVPAFPASAGSRCGARRDRRRAEPAACGRGGPGHRSCRPREGRDGAAPGMSWVGWTQAAPQVRRDSAVPGWGVALGAAEAALPAGRVGGPWSVPPVCGGGR